MEGAEHEGYGSNELIEVVGYLSKKIRTPSSQTPDNLIELAGPAKIDSALTDFSYAIGERDVLGPLTI